MVTIDEQISSIEKEIRETPYHKATEHHIGKLRARLSKLKDKLYESAGKGGSSGGGYAVKKQGDATIVLVGPPSSGKSTLINKLTNAQSKVAPYAFTTVTVIPGMMEFRHAKIQILDVPGLIKGSGLGKGRGKEVLSVIRGADLVLILTDIDRWKEIDVIVHELEGAGVRLDEQPPKIGVDKKVAGGLIIHSNIKQNLSAETIKSIAREFRITNAQITLNEKVTIDGLVDKFSANRVYRKTLLLINKTENVAANLKNQIAEKYPSALFISSEFDINLDILKTKIWKALEFVTLYLVGPQQTPNIDNSLVVKTGSSLAEVLVALGSDKAQNYKKAKIWGTGSKFDGQEVSVSTLVKENMQTRFF